MIIHHRTQFGYKQSIKSDTLTERQMDTMIPINPPIPNKGHKDELMLNEPTWKRCHTGINQDRKHHNIRNDTEQEVILTLVQCTAFDCVFNFSESSWSICAGTYWSHFWTCCTWVKDRNNADLLLEVLCLCAKDTKQKEFFRSFRKAASQVDRNQGVPFVKMFRVRRKAWPSLLIAHRQNHS